MSSEHRASGHPADLVVTDRKVSPGIGRFSRSEHAERPARLLPRDASLNDDMIVDLQKSSTSGPRTELREGTKAPERSPSATSAKARNSRASSSESSSFRWLRRGHKSKADDSCDVASESPKARAFSGVGFRISYSLVASFGRTANSPQQRPGSEEAALPKHKPKSPRFRESWRTSGRAPQT